MHVYCGEITAVHPGNKSSLFGFLNDSILDSTGAAYTVIISAATPSFTVGQIASEGGLLVPETAGKQF
jgi:hypothetical protein